MIKCIFIPGLRYEGENEDRAVLRESAMSQNNQLVDEMIRRNKQPMAGYREWALKYDLLFTKTNQNDEYKSDIR